MLRLIKKHWISGRENFETNNNIDVNMYNTEWQIQVLLVWASNSGMYIW